MYVWNMNSETMTSDTTSKTSTSTPLVPNRRSKTRIRRQDPRKTTAAPVEINLAAAQQWATAQVKAKKGNTAMFRFIADQLGDLANIQRVLKSAFGDEVVARLRAEWGL